jgi:hypothetical protein
MSEAKGAEYPLILYLEPCFRKIGWWQYVVVALDEDPFGGCASEKGGEGLPRIVDGAVEQVA